jgi:hypothetical protein
VGGAVAWVDAAQQAQRVDDLLVQVGHGVSLSPT